MPRGGDNLVGACGHANRRLSLGLRRQDFLWERVISTKRVVIHIGFEHAHDPRGLEAFQEAVAPHFHGLQKNHRIVFAPRFEKFISDFRALVHMIRDPGKAHEMHR